MPGPQPRRARFEALFREHHSAVQCYARRRVPPGVVDDIVAETFLVVWRRLDDVPEPALPWLLTVARNVAGTDRRGAVRRERLWLKAQSGHVEGYDPGEREIGDGRVLGARGGRGSALRTRPFRQRPHVCKLAPNRASAALEDDPEAGYAKDVPSFGRGNGDPSEPRTLMPRNSGSPGACAFSAIGPRLACADARDR